MEELSLEDTIYGGLRKPLTLKYLLQIVIALNLTICLQRHSIVKPEANKQRNEKTDLKKISITGR